VKGWTYSFAATKDDKGQLVILAQGYFNRALSSVQPGEVFDLTIAEHQEKRSNKQNRMVWGTVLDQLIAGLAADQYEPHERAEAKELIYEGLCARFQGYVTDAVTGQQVRKFRGSKATKAEFTEFVEWVARFAAQEYGIVITLPGEAA
jgi:hypothetical protein